MTKIEDYFLLSCFDLWELCFFLFDLYSLTSRCWASASLTGEAVVHDVEVI